MRFIAAIALAGATAHAALSQSLPKRSMGQDVADCTEPVDDHPCRVAVDRVAMLRSSVDTSIAAAKTPRVWVLVSATGEVKHTRIHQSAGVDADLAAVKVAKELRFEPAAIAGRPVASWLVLPINVSAVPESCDIMAVPASAGVARFVDSTVFDKPDLGTQYHFAAAKDLGLDDALFDVFLFPATNWPEPARQGADMITVLEGYQRDGKLAEFHVLKAGAERVDVQSSATRKRFEGYMVRAELKTTDEVNLESLMWVFRDRDRYVKFRITYPPTRGYREAAVGFIIQVLEALASAPPHCR
ncbi:MAG TPA: hypothetical protein VFT29_18190 [Gemmatimonadaceae bacterium]|nr:hypothetical protein [Gemmatimonadaceae bacterium]